MTLGGSRWQKYWAAQSELILGCTHLIFPRIKTYPMLSQMFFECWHSKSLYSPAYSSSVFPCRLLSVYKDFRIRKLSSVTPYKVNCRSGGYEWRVYHTELFKQEFVQSLWEGSLWAAFIRGPGHQEVSQAKPLDTWVLASQRSSSFWKRGTWSSYPLLHLCRI